MRWDFARAALLGALVSLPLSLALVAVPLSSTADASATDMLLLTNQFRYAVGSPTVPADPRLTQAAQNHANYNSANGILGHFETAGLPYYTGYSARDRLIAQGWTTSFVSEVATGGSELYGPNGVRLPFYVAPQQFEYDYQVIVPQGPLATNTTYHVRFDITVAGTWLTNEWNFSTGSTISGGGPTSTVPSDNGLHSAWTSQTQMPAMQPASTSQVTLLFRNTGTKTWTRGLAGSQVALGVNGDSGAFSALGMNVGWPSANRVAIQNEVSVGPGAVATFTFTVKAPFSAGTVRIPLRPVVDGVAWLEDQGVFVPVMTVVDYHSRWVSESAFPTLRVGQVSGPLSIAFRNAGSQSWIRGTLGQEARLAVNQDNAQWAALGVNWMSANRVAAQTEATVVPGGVGTFTFQVRAPMTPGLYAIHLRPVIDAVTWMEDEGVFLYITVTN